MKQGRLPSWLYLAPALFIMRIFIVAPTFNTIYLSFTDKSGTNSIPARCTPGSPCWGAFDNYRYAFTHPLMLTALRNYALWPLSMLPGTVASGQGFAVLAERVRYESIARPALFTLMVISFFSAGVIWRCMYYIQTSEGP
jgi:alpha-glucoside transport system permease protein